MLHQPPPVPQLLEQLQNFAAQVAEVMADPTLDWQWRPAPTEWALTELFCHLRDVELEVHQPRFRSMMASENAFMPGATADVWAEERGYAGQNGRSALNAFLRARQETIDLLTTVADDFWQRQGRHAFFGPTSAHELLNLVVNHDQDHWQQLETLRKRA